MNAAGIAPGPAAERDVARCFRENAVGPEILARACAAAGLPFVTFSTERVFDGRLGRAYVEDDPTSPIDAFGSSKAEAERRVLAAHPEGALVVRSGPFFGPWDNVNRLWSALHALSRGETARVERRVTTPTYGPDLAHVTLDLLIDGATGLWHLTNPSAGLSWRDIVGAVAARAGLPTERLVESAASDPLACTALTSARGLLLPPLDSALDRFLQEGAMSWAPVRSVAAE